jgi:hypothetical protein
MTAFEAFYGYQPPYQSVRNVAVEEYMKERKVIEVILKENLQKAVSRMQFFAKKRDQKEYLKWEIGSISNYSPALQTELSSY